ncbi:MAG: phage related protein [Thermoleophilia bacterium]|nr:phage related protein [Thermoleophilia bacterium]
MSDAAARLEGVVALVGVPAAVTGLKNVGAAATTAQKGLDDVERAAKRADGAVGHLGGAATGAGTDLDRAAARARAASEQVEHMRGRFDRAGTSMKSMGRTLSVGVTAPLVGLAAISFSKFAEFDQTIRQVGSVADISGRKLETMRETAMKLGRDTSFSANEAATAMLELAKGGITQAQMGAGVLDQTLTLAAAGGLQLGDAAGYMTNTLNAFGLSAGRSAGVAAALAGGANASTASVESLGMGLAQVSAQAKQSGMSMNETIAALAAFDQAGVKGSDAGTSLKTMLQRLVPSTKEAAAGMKKLGVDFTDAKGNFLPMRDVAEQLKVGLGKLGSESERTAALTTIFGSDSSRAAGILGTVGAAGIDKYTAATKNMAAAQDLARTNTEGAKGSIEQMMGSLETAGIAIGTVLAPKVTALADHIASMANAFTQLDPHLQSTALMVGAVAVAVGPLLIAFGMMASGAAALIPLFAAVSAPMLLIGGAAVVAGVGLVQLYRHSETARTIVSGLWDVIKASPLGSLVRMVNAGAQSFGGWGNVLRGAAIAFLEFGKVVLQMSLSVIRTFNDMTGNLADRIKGAAKMLAFLHPEFKGVAKVAEEMSKDASRSTSKMERAMSGDIQAITRQINTLKAEMNSIPDEDVSIRVRTVRVGSLENFSPTNVLQPVKKAKGGIIRGPGTGTSDSIPAWISNGEAVIPESSTARNRELVEWLIDHPGEKLPMPGFAAGKKPKNPADARPYGNGDGKVTAAELSRYAKAVAGGDVGAAKFDASTADPDLLRKRESAAAALEQSIKDQNTAIAGKDAARGAVLTTANAQKAMQSRYDKLKTEAEKKKLKPALDLAKARAAAAKARYDKLLATISGAGDKRRSLAGSVVSLDQQLSSSANDQENLRREALGLESVEEEQRRNAINAVRRQNGLAELNRGDTLNSDGTITRADSASSTGTDSGPDPDLAAQLAQSQKRATDAQANFELSQSQFATLRGSGDLGFGGGANALQSAGGAQPVVVNINSMTAYDPSTLQAVASAAGGGFNQGGNADQLYSGRG